MSSNFGEFECKLENCLSDSDGTLVLSLRIPKTESYCANQAVATIKTKLINGNERLKIGFSWYREKRSLNANSYFHVLVDKVAKVMQIGADECKVHMVLDYGTVATECGDTIFATLPKSAKATNYYQYPKWISDFDAKNGKPYSQYLLYKRTHELDKAEMQRLIEGVIYEAKELDIETCTPDELASLIENSFKFKNKEA